MEFLHFNCYRISALFTKSRLLSVVVIAFFTLLFTLSCERIRCIDGEGKNIIETVNLAAKPFNGIISQENFEIEIVQDADKAYQVEIETYENLIPYILTEVKGNNLVIGTVKNRCIRSNFPIRITIYVPTLDYISLEGSGNIECYFLLTDNLQVDLLGSGGILLQDIDALDVNVNLDGSGYIELTGKSNSTHLSLTGSGQLLADNLRHYNCFVNLSGSGDMLVFAIDRIEGNLSGSGDLFYKIYPRKGISIERTGTGEILKL